MRKLVLKRTILWPERAVSQVSVPSRQTMAYAFFRSSSAAIPPECSAVRLPGRSSRARACSAPRRCVSRAEDVWGLVFLFVARARCHQLEHLGGRIFHNGGQVDGSTGADAPHGYLAATTDTADGGEDPLDSDATSCYLHFTTATAGHGSERVELTNNDTE
ncbi:hypothetical protein EVAR_38923_1 [Eumeta japonica]|uniref:Uncharacterized protein n=1 Tax=Eumeta variegata TaxID=151549 RepID=A0A4C1ZTV0_EUMVA|nr:hypothetical protein EVAR_38923_1 [Eumeta japonica]